MRSRKRATATAVAREDLNVRATEAANALGVPTQMRAAAIELVYNHDYEQAAEKASVTADVVRGWAEDPLFIAAIGWFVVGLSDNRE
jgi:hypothetical protein